MIEMVIENLHMSGLLLSNEYEFSRSNNGHKLINDFVYPL